MSQLDLKKLYEKQISLTEWFEKINHVESEALRVEDNDKRTRLRVLYDTIGLPFDIPTEFHATQIANRVPAVEAYARAHANELCALRLIPLLPELPKLRTRGQTVRDALRWFDEQRIDPEKYKAHFLPHMEKTLWSTIFVIGDKGAWGEIIPSTHAQLTQGFHEDGPPIIFTYDFSKIKMSRSDPVAETQLYDIIGRLRVHDTGVQQQLAIQIGAEFASGYVKGYYETTTTAEYGLWFIDYNRILGRLYGSMDLPVVHASSRDAVVTGSVGTSGSARGRVRIVQNPTEATDFVDGDILVCSMTTPEFVPLMTKAAAIITDQGGILSHAAIVSRELKKPCIVGTRKATVKLQHGDMVEVDADRGIVRRVTSA